MKPVTDLVNRSPRPTEHDGKPKATSPALPPHWVDALFTKLRARYTTQWTSRFNQDADYDIAKREWGEVLADLSGAELKHGLKAWDGKYPPNVFEFRNMCRTYRPTSEAHKLHKSLPLPNTDPELAKTNISKMREALK